MILAEYEHQVTMQLRFPSDSNILRGDHFSQRASQQASQPTSQPAASQTAAGSQPGPAASRWPASSRLASQPASSQQPAASASQPGNKPATHPAPCCSSLAASRVTCRWQFSRPSWLSRQARLITWHPRCWQANTIARQTCGAWGSSCTLSSAATLLFMEKPTQTSLPRSILGFFPNF